MAFFRSLSGVAVGVAMLLGTAARAEQSMTVYLGGSCMPPGTSADEVLRMLEAELSPVRVRTFMSVEAIREGDAILGVDGCTDSPLGARVSVIRHGERRERFVALSDAAPSTLGRTLSLALAEAARDPRATDPVPEAWPLATSRTTMVSIDQKIPAPSNEAPDTPGPRGSGVTPRAGVLFRFMPASSTPALGVDAGVAYGRVTAGLMVLGAHQTESLGAATLVAIAGSASFDVVEIGAFVTARVAGELGAAIGSPSPNATAIGHTRAAPHGALLGGLASTLPLGDGYGLETFIGGGYASSLNAEADGRRLASLGGGLLAVEMGIRFP